MENILKAIEEYINEKNQSKIWVAGQDWVQYAGSYFTADEYVETTKSLLNGWLALGESGIRFEQLFPRLMGKEYGILTNSGSSSNLIMMSAMTSKRLYNFPKGTKVITPIAGFPTTINPIFQVGFEPVFVDIDLDTLNLNLDQVEEKAKDGCKIITFAHVLGNPPNMDRLMEIVKKYDLVLLEDCCDALGSTYKNKPLGSFGELASCSFYPAHHITMGEGGFVACNTHQQEIVTRSFREWGRGCYCVGKKANLLKNGSCKKRFSNWLPALPDEIFDHKYVYDEIGYNLKPIDMLGSIGSIQLKKFDEVHQKRRSNKARLHKIFETIPGVRVVGELPDAETSWFGVPIICDGDKAKLVKFLEDNKIQTRNYFAGNLLIHPAYRHLESAFNYPNAMKILDNVFFIGCSPVITDEMIDYIEGVVIEYIQTIL